MLAKNACVVMHGDTLNERDAETVKDGHGSSELGLHAGKYQTSTAQHDGGMGAEQLTREEQDFTRACEDAAQPLQSHL